MQNRIIAFISLFLIISTSLSAQFITTWKTDNPGSSNDNQITIPTTGLGYDYNIDWGDGIADISVTGTKTHTYAIPGTYTVTITGIFPRIYFNNVDDKDKILTIENWGPQVWDSMVNAFYGCSNLSITASDAPNFSIAFQLTNMFRSSGLTTEDLSGWDVSSIETFNGMFRSTSFNGNIDDWDVSGAEQMSEMFFFASSFNRDIGSWKTENVYDMALMFAGATVFNQDISFNNDGLGAWNTGGVNNMNQMLAGTEDFDQPIGNWNTSSVTNIAAIFSSAHAFNQDVSGWDLTGVTDPSGLSGLFRDATSFNQDLSAWGVAIGGITNLSEMFKGATAFDQDLSGWDVSSVTNMSSLFENTTFNQDITGWSVDNVSNFSGMFQNNTAFNQDISAANWNIASAFDLRLMFDGASAFDQDLGGWNVSNITGNRMIKMFDNSGLSIDNYDNALIGWAGQAVQSGVSLGANNLYYCAGSAARASLIVQGWTITDAGQGCISVYKGNDTTGSKIINAQVQPFDFGSINQGASKTFSFTIDNNTGSDLSNFIGNITTNTGTAFSLLTPPTLPTTLNTGSPITLTIELTNLAPGSFTETVTLNYDTYTASTEQFTFTITGEVTNTSGPEIKVFEGNTTDGTELLDAAGFFYVGGVERGGTAPTNQIIIENKGSDVLNITGITLPASVFSFTPLTVVPIPINGTQIIDLSVDASTGGSFSKMLIIESTDADEPTFEITLNATIYGPEINVIDGTDIFSDPLITNGLATTIDFGSVLEGTDIIRQFTLTNYGPVDLTIQSINIPASPFSSIFSVPTVIPGIVDGIASTAVISITLDGTVAGSFNEIITINSDDDLTPSFTFNIAGTIIDPNAPKVYWTDGSQINRTNLDGSGFQQYYTDPSYSPSGIEIDTLNKLVYWTNNWGQIKKGSIGDTGLTGVIDFMNDGIDINRELAGLALDVDGQKIYWVSKFNGTINSANLTAMDPTSVPTTTIVTGLINPSGVAIDPVGGFIYYTENITDVNGDNIASLHRINIDGTNDTILATETIAGQQYVYYDVVIDVASNFIYWTASNGNQFSAAGDLFQANLADVGGSKTTIALATNLPFGIDLDVSQNKVYWTDYEGYMNSPPVSVNRVNTDGTGKQILQSDFPNLSIPTFIALDVSQTTGCLNPPTISAGGNQTICEGSTVTLLALQGGEPTSISWATNGDGTFSSINSLSTTYTPGPNDIIAGAITIGIMADDPDGSGPCIGTSTEIQLTINPAPTVSAGSDIINCTGLLYILNEASIGGSASTVLWSTSGSGTFGNTSDVVTYYTPSPADVAAGSVILTITTDDPDGIGPCVAVTDQLIMSFSSATVNAGADITSCGSGDISLSGGFGGAASSILWSSPSGGTFIDATLTNAIYTPSAADITLGSVILTITTDDPDGSGPCPAATDQVIIAFSALPTVNAGTNQTVCGNDPIGLSGSFGGAASSISWSSLGDGTFSDTTDPNSTYTPGSNDIIAGSATLTLTSINPASCSSVSDNMIITLTTVSTNAGTDQTICSNGSATLAATVTNATAGTWSTSGDGSFDNSNNLNATYTPGLADASNSVTLTFTTEDPDGTGPCLPATDQVVISVAALPTVSANLDQVVCETSSVSLNGSFGGSTTSISWSSSGDGSFSSTTEPLASYTPGSNDLIARTVTLTITSINPASCNTVTDDVIISFETTHTADAGADQTICPSDIITLTGAVGGGATSATWSTLGDGTFDDNTSLTANYTPGSNDSSSGTVILTLSTVATNCSSVSDQIQLNISLPISAANQSARLQISETVIIDVLNGASINSGDVITTTILSQPTKGTATINNDGTINYLALSGNVGDDSFVFQIENQCNQTASASALITIANAPPAFDDGNATAVPGSPIVISITDLITDLNGNIDLSSITIIQQPASGAPASLDSDNNLVVDYTGIVFFGTDEIVIEVCDFGGACTVASIFITVEALPIEAYNAVSPNGDGRHDFLEFKYIEAYPNNQIKIFNRWGDIVFEIKNYDNLDNIFTGNANRGGNNELPTGTYYYTVHLIDSDETVNGYFELRR